LLRYWKQNEETDTVKKAGRFLFLSNYTYLSKGNTIRFCIGCEKDNLLKRFDLCRDYLSDVRFMNCDFRKVISNISFKKRENDYKRSFIYADPPYIATDGRYEYKWGEKDTEDLFHLLVNSGVKFAVSEFDSEKVLELAKQYRLHVHIVGERKNIMNRRTEVLITNYSVNYEKQLE
jgi:DNA adenine methylase